MTGEIGNKRVESWWLIGGVVEWQGKYLVVEGKMDRDRARFVLQDKGLIATKYRVGVLMAMSGLGRPVDVDGLRVGLEREGLKPDEVTVYRTLKLLVSEELVDEVDFGEGRLRYELKGKHHHHLVCEVCGEVEMVTECLAEKLVERVQQRVGFKIKRHNLEFFGVCRQCQRN